MRIVTATSLIFLLTTGFAMAGPGSGEPKTPSDPSSGRPGAILDDGKCTSVWGMTQRDGDALSEGKAAPFIVNFKMVDTDGDGKVSEAEFKDGCKKGWVQEATAEGTQQPSGKASSGETQPTPTTPKSE